MLNRETEFLRQHSRGTGPQHQQFGIADNNACSQSLLPTLNSEALALQPWIFFRRWIVFCSMQTWWVSAPLLPMQGQWQNSADFWVPEDVDLIWWKKKKKKGVRKIVSQFIAQVDCHNSICAPRLGTSWEISAVCDPQHLGVPYGQQAELKTQIW